MEEQEKFEMWLISELVDDLSNLSDANEWATPEKLFLA
jgi:hypothetical protein